MGHTADGYTPGPWRWRMAAGDQKWTDPRTGAQLAAREYVIETENEDLDDVEWIATTTATDRAQANAILIASAPDMQAKIGALGERLRDLAEIAQGLNARQHAHLHITPGMWSDLYVSTNKAKAALKAAGLEK